MAELQETVGGNIRQQRQRLGLSQQALADRTGVSRRMITLIEAGDGNASLATLDRLAAGLQLTFGNLVQTAEETSGQKPVEIWQGKDRRSKARLLQSCAVQDQVELWSWSLAPGDRYEAEADPAGMRELIVVTSGMLDLEIEGTLQRLRAGQSVSFASDQPYAYINPGRSMLHFIKNVVR